MWRGLEEEKRRGGELTRCRGPIFAGIYIQTGGYLCTTLQAQKQLKVGKVSVRMYKTMRSLNR